MVNVIISGIDYTPDVITTSRRVSLKDPCAVAQVELRYGIDTTPVYPGATIDILESSVQVFTGFIDDVVAEIQRRSYTVVARDRFKLAQDFYIVDHLVTDGESSQYWAGYICGLVGITPLFSAGSGVYMSRGVVLGRKYASAALTEICAASGWQMRMSNIGELEFIRIQRPVAPTFDLPTLSASVRVSDDTTRNVVKVWGFDASAGSGIYVRRRRDVPGVPIEKVAVYANPNISSGSYAYLVAEAGLDQWASLDVSGDQYAIGDPDVVVGESAIVRCLSNDVMDTITSLSAEASPSGYTMHIAVGERTARYPYWPVGKAATSGSRIVWVGDGAVGEAFDAASDGARVYIAGYTEIPPGGREFGRVECRSAQNGALIWARNFAAFGGYNSRFHSIAADQTYLYVGCRYQTFYTSPYEYGYVRLRALDGALSGEITAGSSFIGLSGCVKPRGMIVNRHGLITWGDETPLGDYTVPPDARYIYLNSRPGLSLIRRVSPPGDSGYYAGKRIAQSTNGMIYAPSFSDGINFISDDLTTVYQNRSGSYPTMAMQPPLVAPLRLVPWSIEYAEGSSVLQYTQTGTFPVADMITLHNVYQNVDSSDVGQGGIIFYGGFTADLECPKFLCAGKIIWIVNWPGNASHVHVVSRVVREGYLYYYDQYDIDLHGLTGLYGNSASKISETRAIVLGYRINNLGYRVFTSVMINP